MNDSDQTSAGSQPAQREPAPPSVVIAPIYFKKNESAAASSLFSKRIIHPDHQAVKNMNAWSFTNLVVHTCIMQSVVVTHASGACEGPVGGEAHPRRPPYQPSFGPSWLGALARAVRPPTCPPGWWRRTRRPQIAAHQARVIA
jgi:hypothetical protein